MRAVTISLSVRRAIIDVDPSNVVGIWRGTSIVAGLYPKCVPVTVIGTDGEVIYAFLNTPNLGINKREWLPVLAMKLKAQFMAEKSEAAA